MSHLEWIITNLLIIYSKYTFFFFFFFKNGGLLNYIDHQKKIWSSVPKLVSNDVIKLVPRKKEIMFFIDNIEEKVTKSIGVLNKNLGN